MVGYVPGSLMLLSLKIKLISYICAVDSDGMLEPNVLYWGYSTINNVLNLCFTCYHSMLCALKVPDFFSSMKIINFSPSQLYKLTGNKKEKGLLKIIQGPITPNKILNRTTILFKISTSKTFEIFNK